jgi:hypothetical protein
MKMRPKKPAATIACYCQECGSSFYVKGDEVAVLPSMQPTRGWRKGDPLTTWADWVMHVQTHCPDCRIIVPPPDCINDLHAHVKACLHVKPEDFSEELDERTRRFNGE